MGPDGTRIAFQIWPALEHKSQTSFITTVAVNQAGTKLYLGLSDGQLEEHGILGAPPNVRLSLGARKHVGKKPVAAVAHLEAARRLAILCEGLLWMLDHDSLEGGPLPGVKGVTALALQGGGVYPPRLALALRAGKRAARVMVYEVLSGADAASPRGSTALCTAQCQVPEPLPITAMAWLGQRLVCCTAGRYMLLAPGKGGGVGGGGAAGYTLLFALPDEAPPPSMVQPVPAAAAAVLLMDQVGLLVDGEGQPAGSALAFPSRPYALAAAGLYVLAACAEGVHIYDRTSGAWVQSLPYPDGARPAPGQQLATAGNAKGTCVIVAGRRKVWMLTPVAAEETAAELLRARHWGQALDLAAACAAQGAPWAETAFAEAGFLLLHELRWAEACAALARCSGAVFQPLELFPLFPAATAPWAHLAPAKAYWGLHPPLADLDTLIARKVGGNNARRNSAPASPASPAAAANGGLAGGQGGGLHRRATSEALAEGLRADAMQGISDYLLKVRCWEGVEAPDGVDTLLCHLLAALGAAGDLERFAAAPNAARVEAAAPALAAAGRHHALALLAARHGQPQRALHIWKGLAEGSLVESPSESSAIFTDAAAGAEGASNVAQVAIRHAAALMADAARVPAGDALALLPWLLAASPDHCLQLLKARQLPPEQVLPLLRQATAPEGAQEVRWRYLHHLVTQQGSQEPSHHTELALALAEAALALMPLPLAPSEAAALTMAQRRARRAETEGGEGEAGAALRERRRALQALLADSGRYDVGGLLARLRPSELWQEQVLLHCKVGDHVAALRVLALTLGDLPAALAYCQAAVGGQEGYLALLDILLRPPAPLPPLLDEACHLLAARGALVDPVRLLNALAEDMPLARAHSVLARMLRERIHRRRAGSIERALEKAHNLAHAAERAELMGRRVVTSEERACRLCHTRIGTKMFAVYPNGVLVCFKCYRQGDEAVCPLTGRDFRKQQLAPAERWPD